MIPGVTVVPRMIEMIDAVNDVWMLELVESEASIRRKFEGPWLIYNLNVPIERSSLSEAIHG
jgi:hypothetical protein